MKWTWFNSTQVVFGEYAVRDYLKRWIKPNSRVLCTFGGGSIDQNGARKDVVDALDALNCDHKWEGGIPANPEYDRLVEIVKVARQYKPDFLLAVGGGSIIDGTKFISMAINLPENTDLWTILTDKVCPEIYVPIGTVLTLPASGSEWNNSFVVSRRSIKGKIGIGNEKTYPVFSLLDPRYTMTLPVRQLRNGVYDSLTHCIDFYLSPESDMLTDYFMMTVFKELVTIGPDVIKPDSSIELHERLIRASSFALNQVLFLGRRPDISIHLIGHMLTALYGIDHGVTLAIVTIPFYENKVIFESRIETLAKSADFVFDVHEGTVAEKAHAFVSKLRDFIQLIGMPSKVSEVEGVVINQGDVAKLTDMVMDSVNGNCFGVNGITTRAVVEEVFTKIIQ